MSFIVKITGLSPEKYILHRLKTISQLSKDATTLYEKTALIVNGKVVPDESDPSIICKEFHLLMQKIIQIFMDLDLLSSTSNRDKIIASLNSCSNDIIVHLIKFLCYYYCAHQLSEQEKDTNEWNYLSSISSLCILVIDSKHSKINNHSDDAVTEQSQITEEVSDGIENDIMVDDNNNSSIIGQSLRLYSNQNSNAIIDTVELINMLILTISNLQNLNPTERNEIIDFKQYTSCLISFTNDYIKVNINNLKLYQNRKKIYLHISSNVLPTFLTSSFMLKDDPNDSEGTNALKQNILIMISSCIFDDKSVDEIATIRQIYEQLTEQDSNESKKVNKKPRLSDDNNTNNKISFYDSFFETIGQTCLNNNNNSIFHALSLLIKEYYKKSENISKSNSSNGQSHNYIKNKKFDNIEVVDESNNKKHLLRIFHFTLHMIDSLQRTLVGNKINNNENTKQLTSFLRYRNSVLSVLNDELKGKALPNNIQLQKYINRLNVMTTNGFGNCKHLHMEIKNKENSKICNEELFELYQQLSLEMNFIITVINIEPSVVIDNKMSECMEVVLMGNYYFFSKDGNITYWNEFVIDHYNMRVFNLYKSVLSDSTTQSGELEFLQQSNKSILFQRYLLNLFHSQLSLFRSLLLLYSQLRTIDSFITEVIKLESNLNSEVNHYCNQIISDEIIESADIQSDILKMFSSMPIGLVYSAWTNLSSFSSINEFKYENFGLKRAILVQMLIKGMYKQKRSNISYISDNKSDLNAVPEDNLMNCIGAIFVMINKKIEFIIAGSSNRGGCTRLLNTVLDCFSTLLQFTIEYNSSYPILSVAPLQIVIDIANTISERAEPTILFIIKEFIFESVKSIFSVNDLGNQLENNAIVVGKIRVSKYLNAYFSMFTFVINLKSKLSFKASLGKEVFIQLDQFTMSLRTSFIDFIRIDLIPILVKTDCNIDLYSTFEILSVLFDILMNIINWSSFISDVEFFDLMKILLTLLFKHYLKHLCHQSGDIVNSSDRVDSQNIVAVVEKIKRLLFSSIIIDFQIVSDSLMSAFNQVLEELDYYKNLALNCNGDNNTTDGTVIKLIKVPSIKMIIDTVPSVVIFESSSTITKFHLKFCYLISHINSPNLTEDDKEQLFSEIESISLLLDSFITFSNKSEILVKVSDNKKNIYNNMAQLVRNQGEESIYNFMQSSFQALVMLEGSLSIVTTLVYKYVDFFIYSTISYLETMDMDKRLFSLQLLKEILRCSKDTLKNNSFSETNSRLFNHITSCLFSSCSFDVGSDALLIIFDHYKSVIEVLLQPYIGVIYNSQNATDSNNNMNYQIFYYLADCLSILQDLFIINENDVLSPTAPIVKKVHLYIESTSPFIVKLWITMMSRFIDNENNNCRISTEGLIYFFGLKCSDILLYCSIISINQTEDSEIASIRINNKEFNQLLDGIYFIITRHLSLMDNFNWKLSHHVSISHINMISSFLNIASNRSCNLDIVDIFKVIDNNLIKRVRAEVNRKNNIVYAFEIYSDLIVYFTKTQANNSPLIDCIIAAAQDSFDNIISSHSITTADDLNTILYIFNKIKYITEYMIECIRNNSISKSNNNNNNSSSSRSKYNKTKKSQINDNNNMIDTKFVLKFNNWCDGLFQWISLVYSKLFIDSIETHSAISINIINLIFGIIEKIVHTSSFTNLTNLNTIIGNIVYIFNYFAEKLITLENIYLLHHNSNNTNNNSDNEDSIIKCYHVMSRILIDFSASKDINKHSNFIISVIIDKLVKLKITVHFNDIVYPGIYYLFEKCDTKQKKQIYSLLNTQSKLFMTELHDNFMRTFKFVGK